ncbi:MAG: efflux RND transporter periplasmic adaptor subunit [Hyphomicrobiales bacterium]|nr:efflux RND transporter periplasmic adaptor subunit [Hyphomicrobiales bacterium]
MSMRNLKKKRAQLALIFAIPLALAVHGINDTAFAADGEAIQGKLVFWRTGKIASPVMGRIKNLPKRIGDSVEQGEVVALIDTQQLEAELSIARQALATAEAELVSERAELQSVETTFNRIEQLKDSPAFTRARLEDATNAVAIAKATVKAAEALVAERKSTVDKRELDVKLATIEAPFDGVVVRQLLTVGGLVSTDDPHILIMVDTATPEIEVDVPAEQVNALSVGTEVSAQIDNSGRQTARVRSIAPAATSDAETRTVRLDLVKPEGTYRDTVPVTIYLPES